MGAGSTGIGACFTGGSYYFYIFTSSSCLTISNFFGASFTDGFTSYLEAFPKTEGVTSFLGSCLIGFSLGASSTTGTLGLDTISSTAFLAKGLLLRGSATFLGGNFVSYLGYD